MVEVFPADRIITPKGAVALDDADLAFAWSLLDVIICEDTSWEGFDQAQACGVIPVVVGPEGDQKAIEFVPNKTTFNVEVDYDKDVSVLVEAVDLDRVDRFICTTPRQYVALRNHLGNDPRIINAPVLMHDTAIKKLQALDLSSLSVPSLEQAQARLDSKDDNSSNIYWSFQERLKQCSQLNERVSEVDGSWQKYCEQIDVFISMAATIYPYELMEAAAQGVPIASISWDGADLIYPQAILATNTQELADLLTKTAPTTR